MAQGDRRCLSSLTLQDPLDSVEFCPVQRYNHLFAVAAYRLQQPEEPAAGERENERNEEDASADDNGGKANAQAAVKQQHRSGGIHLFQLNGAAVARRLRGTSVCNAAPRPSTSGSNADLAAAATAEESAPQQLSPAVARHVLRVGRHGVLDTCWLATTTSSSGTTVMTGGRDSCCRGDERGQSRGRNREGEGREGSGEGNRWSSATAAAGAAAGEEGQYAYSSADRSAGCSDGCPRSAARTEVLLASACADGRVRVHRLAGGEGGGRGRMAGQRAGEATNRSDQPARSEGSEHRGEASRLTAATRERGGAAVRHVPCDGINYAWRVPLVYLNDATPRLPMEQC